MHLINIILGIIIAALVWYLYKVTKEPFDINTVQPAKTKFIPTLVDNMDFHENIPQTCEDAECSRIDKYRNNFFDFQNRLNHNSHLNDSVDNINITNKAQDYMLGQDVSIIYDSIVNTNDYKPTTNEISAMLAVVNNN